MGECWVFPCAAARPLPFSLILFPFRPSIGLFGVPLQSHAPEKKKKKGKKRKKKKESFKDTRKRKERGEKSEAIPFISKTLRQSVALRNVENALLFHQKGRVTNTATERATVKEDRFHCTEVARAL